MHKVQLVGGLDGSLAQGIYSNNLNKMLKFGIGGKFLGEFPLDFKHSRIREIDLISIIAMDNAFELAYVINNTFNKFEVYADIFQIIQWLDIQPSLVFVAKREVQVGKLQGVQYFYGFTQGNITEQLVQEVMG